MYNISGKAKNALDLQNLLENIRLLIYVLQHVKSFPKMSICSDFDREMELVAATQQCLIRVRWKMIKMVIVCTESYMWMYKISGAAKNALEVQNLLENIPLLFFVLQRVKMIPKISIY